jgi:hypothetical protein
MLTCDALILTSCFERSSSLADENNNSEEENFLEYYNDKNCAVFVLFAIFLRNSQLISIKTLKNENRNLNCLIKLQKMSIHRATRFQSHDSTVLTFRI